MEKILFLKDEEKISKERKFSILRQHLVRWNVNPILKFVPCGRMEKGKKRKRKRGEKKGKMGSRPDSIAKLVSQSAIRWFISRKIPLEEEAWLINEQRRARCQASNSSIYLPRAREVSPLTLIPASLHRLPDIKARGETGYRVSND